MLLQASLLITMALSRDDLKNGQVDRERQALTR